MKILNIIIFLALNFTSHCQEINKRVHLTGDFPNVKGAHLFMYNQNIDTPLINGKFDIILDSVKKGEYTINIIYPWPKADTTFYKDSSGNINKKVSKYSHEINLNKNFYIDPNQSLNYHFQLADNVTPGMLKDWVVINYGKNDIYGIRINSYVEDTKLYDKFEQLNVNFKNTRFYKIVDSLYKIDGNKNKTYVNFYTKADTLNFAYNYQNYINSEVKLIKKNLTNPISALTILNIPKAQFEKNKNEYEKLLNKMSDRAKNSEYYHLSLLKLKDAKEVLKEGSVFEFPDGKTPELKLFKYNLKKYKYTLVEFWASWCRPCRENNPKWNYLLKKYKGSGFQIMGISLDNSVLRWKKAIKDDNLEEWLHVSDLELGYNGKNALKYGIDYIPYNVLIDSNGKILKKKITPEQLEEILKK